METKHLQIVKTEDFTVYHLDFVDANEEEVVYIFDQLQEIVINSKDKFGVMINTQALFVTPLMRHRGKEITYFFADTNRFIGSCLYHVHDFLKEVALSANPNIQFGKSPEECITLIDRMNKGELPNFLPE